MLKESAKMQRFRHPNVMPLIGVCLDGGPTPLIVMPYMVNGSLLDYLRKERASLVHNTAANQELVCCDDPAFVLAITNSAHNYTPLCSS